jgi:FkbM family methyltransferase
MKKHLIYDVGMCDGSDTECYLSHGFNVLAVEADPSLVEKAEKRFQKYIKAGKLKIVNCGIGQSKGISNFYVNDVYPIWNSFDEKIAARDNLPYHAIEIECTPFDEILEQHGVPYYLKIDIEGMDRYCLAALSPSDLPQYVSIEADNLGDTSMLEQLYDLGYRKFKCINQNNFLPLNGTYISGFAESQLSNNDRLYLRVRYGSHISLRFMRKLGSRQLAERLLKPSRHLRHELGSSGPFGENTLGPWYSFDDIREIYLKSYADYQKVSTNSEYGFWCDFHASL